MKLASGHSEQDVSTTPNKWVSLKAALGAVSSYNSCETTLATLCQATMNITITNFTVQKMVGGKKVKRDRCTEGPLVKTNGEKRLQREIAVFN